MFESAEIGHQVDKETYNQRLPSLRAELINAQFDLAQLKKFPVLLIIGGVDGAGKGEMVNLLNEWMDPRLILTSAFAEASDEERERPAFWRFWRALPPKGRIGILFGSWYTEPIVSKVIGDASTADLDRAIHRIVRFEQMLTEEGVLLLKFWFHLSRKQQKKRLTALEKDRETRWRVTDTDWQRFKIYDTFRKWSEHTLRQTSTGNAPWTVVEGNDPRYRALTVGETLLQAMRHRIDNHGATVHQADAPPLVPPVDNLRILQTLQLDQQLDKEEYNRVQEKYQGELNLLARHPAFRNHSVVVVFEGNDAAGKGGAIRRTVQALDARWYRILQVAAPTDEELAQPYLWRFWRQLPRKGRFLIFDRSWYGRLLVERVEGFCAEPDWMRAYGEINEFEEQLTEHGIILVKFWLAISKEEQYRRFKEREKHAFKQFKITDEDWRNRKKWAEYEQAVSDMVERTNTSYAPWTLVPANNKYHARLEVLKTLVGRLKRALKE